MQRHRLDDGRQRRGTITKIPAQKPPGFRLSQPLPVTIVIAFPVTMVIMMTMPVVVTHADADRADMDTDHRGIGSTGHQAKRNNRSK